MNGMIVSARTPTPRSIFTGIVFAGLILILASAAHPQPRAGEPEASSPQGSADAIQATLSDFYRWYLQMVAKQRDPLRDDRAKIETYVSKALLKKIERQINSPDGLDEDYFTKAQDYMNDWVTDIVVSDVQIDGKVASAKVTLGATKESKQHLLVHLVREGASWKISKVSQPDTP